MRIRLLTGLVVCLVAVSLGHAEEPSDIEKAIKGAADEYLEAFANRDLDGCLATFAKGKKTVLMGTGPGERWVGLKEIGEAHKEMFKAFDKESFERKWSLVSARRNVAWTAGETVITDTVDGKERQFTIHTTSVWVLREDKWQIALMHCSNLTGPEGEQ
jgi:uncharacterized protein (TIGR02246 family)